MVLPNFYEMRVYKNIYFIYKILLLKAVLNFLGRFKDSIQGNH